MFQNPWLFPHLTVSGNIEYGATRATTHRVDSATIVDMLEIGDLLDRKPDSLSGGEAQRVAIASALLRSPDLVLMDEPLASLDHRRKDELLPYFDRLHNELSVPVIYVSHDIEEISRLCDHLVLLDAGKVVAVGNGKLGDDGKRVALEIKKGDRILFGKYAGTEVKIEGEEYLIMREDDVLGVID